MSGFHNQNFVDNNGDEPYENLNTNIFYFSLNYNLFKNSKSYKTKGEKKEFY